jgi:GLPGLI family protein
MKKIINIIILFLCLNIYTQNNKVKVTYKKTLIGAVKHDNDDVQKALDIVFEKSKKYADNLLYTLKIANSISIFKVEEGMEDNMYYRLAVIKGGGGGIYYSDTLENLFLWQKELGGETFLIKKEPVNWILLNETKNVGKYICYKATTTMTVNNYKKTIKKVTAWYCPELPFSFGPIGYCLLPGLILQLEVENTAIFTMDSIIFNTQHLNIKKPKGNVITPLEYYEISKKAYENK